MANLTTRYMGIDLKSPLVAASCGLTADVEKMADMERQGIGAVVLKSIFEEQIDAESTSLLRAAAGNGADYPEAEDYIKAYIHSNTLQQYVDLVAKAKKRLSIPVIASLNCFSGGDWVAFAKRLEEAGADALELNIFLLALDPHASSVDVENAYIDVLRSVIAQVHVPVAVKIGHYFTNLPAFVERLKAHGASAVTLFNRFYEPDIDINTIAMGSAPVFSTPAELRTTLRWTGILAGMPRQLPIAASTGVHDGEAAIKLLLAGATAVQLCSVLYERGVEVIGDMHRFIAEWMDAKGFSSIEAFRGRLSYASIENPALYERAQFMKYFSNKHE